MEKQIFILYYIIALLSYGQVAQHNLFSTIKSTHILDGKLEDVSFVLSIRVLLSDCEAPLIHLSRTVDNAEMDFGRADKDKVDIAGETNEIAFWKI